MYFITFGMSKGLVSQKPFSRKKRRQSIRKTLNRSGVSIPEFKISQKVKNLLSRWLFFTLLIIWGIFILIKLLFFKPEQTISQIKFSEATLATYQDVELFNLISNNVKWKNYYMLLSKKDKLLSDIQKNFPFVWEIKFQLEPREKETITWDQNIVTWIKFPIIKTQTWFRTNQTWTNTESSESQVETTWLSIKIIQNNFPLKLSRKELDNWWTLWIELMYYDPAVLIKLNDKKFAVWNEKTYVEMKEWMLLWIRDPEEEPLFLIETPQYLTWTNNLDWFFFEVKLPEFLQIISLAKEEFWNNMTRLVYLAWSRRFAIFTSDDKTLYFNFPEGWNIEEQRKNQTFKYNTLKERYPNFAKIEKIDLWALEENKTIITNY